MQKSKLLTIFALLINVFVISNSCAQNIRYTSFDDRSYCEQTGGIWRQYGNNCANNCLASSKSNPICMDAITYSCDCGHNRCWNDKKCITIADYKPIFKHIENVKIAKGKENQDLQLKKSHENADASTFSIPVQQAKKTTSAPKADSNNSNEKDDKPPVQIALPTKTTPSPAATTTNTPTTTTATNNDSQLFSVPPVFQQLVNQKAANTIDNAIGNSIVNAVGSVSQK